MPIVSLRFSDRFLYQLRMRGNRVRLDDRPDGEVDENFWAQAAADQAVGRNTEEGDESECLISNLVILVIDRLCFQL